MSTPNESQILKLKKVCNNVRRSILDLTFYGSSSHLGGSLSCVEILVALYFNVMRVDPQNPGWESRDRLVLSKGHAAPGLYAVMAERGYLPKEELKTFCKNGTRLQKHMDMHKLPGIDASSGSLGQGLSVAVGMAMADQMDKKDRYVYCVLGDGELQEGQVWEAVMAAGNLKLDHLVAIVDCNKMQVDGFTKSIMDIEPLAEKWQANRWDVQRIDGNDIAQVVQAIQLAHEQKEKPQIIIADTIKGKGIDFMEFQVDWHAKGLTEEEYKNAVAQVDASRQLLDRGEG